MSIHKSLKSNKFSGKRSIRKRVERLQKLIDDGKTTKEDLKIYGLPKEKVKRIKMKKEKKEVKATEELLEEHKEE